MRLSPRHPGYVMTVCAEESAAALRSATNDVKYMACICEGSVESVEGLQR